MSEGIKGQVRKRLSPPEYDDFLDAWRRDVARIIGVPARRMVALERERQEARPQEVYGPAELRRATAAALDDIAAMAAIRRRGLQEWPRPQMIVDTTVL